MGVDVASIGLGRFGAIAGFDKAMTVAKLKGARDRKSAAAGRRIEGRKSHAVANEAVAMVKRLAGPARRLASAGRSARSRPCWPRPDTSTNAVGCSTRTQSRPCSKDKLPLRFAE